MISICICTYNRSESLQRTLDSLAGQKHIDATEVLVVDNNCTDQTANVVDAFRERLTIRRARENRQGLAYARNRAVADFRGDVLLFTDDDVRFEPGWLTGYRDAIHRFPGADYFGGRILPDWGHMKPRWLGDEPLPLIDGVLVWFDHGAETRAFENAEPPPFGASFAIRRRLFNKIGMFRVDLGTGGSGLGRGEETEFLMRAQRSRSAGRLCGRGALFSCLRPSTPYACGVISLWNCLWKVAQRDCGPPSTRRLRKGGVVRP